MELVQDEMHNTEGKVAGSTFYFRINDKDVFAKGSNWVPADAFHSRVTKETYAVISLY